MNNPFRVYTTDISYISEFPSMGLGLAGLPSDFRKGMEDYTTLTQDFNHLIGMLPGSIGQIIMTYTMSILLHDFTKA